jgi:hypothetical protein
MQGAFLGEDADAGVADDDSLAAFDIAHGDAKSAAVIRFNRNAAIHLLPLDAEPAAAAANLGPLIGGAVEPLGKGAIHVGFYQAAVGLRGGNGAVVADLAKNLGQFGFAAGRHLNQRIAGIRAQAADRNLFDGKRAAEAGNEIEDFGQNQAVNDVAANFDVLDPSGPGGGLGRIHLLSPFPSRRRYFQRASPSSLYVGHQAAADTVCRRRPNSHCRAAAGGK